jgi:hypothetical protein
MMFAGLCTQFVHWLLEEYIYIYYTNVQTEYINQQTSSPTELEAIVQTEYINQQTSSPTELEANVQTEYINQQTSSPTELEANNS